MGLASEMQAFAAYLVREVMGDSVTFIEPDGTELAVVAIRAGAAVGQEIRDERGRRYERTRDVFVLASDMADPTLYSTVEIGSETWTISGPPSKESDSVLRFKCVRRTLAESARENLRVR